MSRSNVCADTLEGQCGGGKPHKEGQKGVFNVGGGVRDGGLEDTIVRHLPRDLSGEGKAWSAVLVVGEDLVGREYLSVESVGRKNIKRFRPEVTRTPVG